MDVTHFAGEGGVISVAVDIRHLLLKVVSFQLQWMSHTLLVKVVSFQLQWISDICC